MVIIILIFYIVMILLSDINKISEEFTKVKIEYISLAILFSSVSLMLRAFRQKKFLDKLGINLSLKKNIALFFSGMSMIITPLGAGELIKSHFLKRNYNQPMSKTSPIVFIERFHDLLAVVTILFTTLIISFFWEGGIILSISLSLLVFLYLIAKNNKFLQFIQKRLSKIKFLKKLIPSSEFNETFSKLTRKEILLTGWGISVASFVFDALAVYMGFLAFAQDFEFVKIVQYYYTSILFGVISFLPAGIGITEGTFVGLLMSSGLELPIASAIVLLTRLTTIWFATMVGFLSYHFVLKMKIEDDNP